MFYRAACLLLVPALLLQGMGTAHTHLGSGVAEPPEHGHSPHFHYLFWGTHSRWHHDQDDHHAHDGVPEDDDDQVDEDVPASDHDDNAIYVPAFVLLCWQCQPSPVGSGDVTALVPLGDTPGSPFTAAAPLRIPLTHPPPLLLCEHCPLYLRVLAILI
jgi:hypothetical protein